MAHPGTKGGKEELKGAEVLELTTFAEKKAWIDSKIAFLSSLPPIVVASPDPPTRSEVTKEQLEEWWKEHDRIEEEVGEYDMGDLAKMRGLARDKSKQALSPRDTDLIEITLTTLFAVDKLLHLLRNRRKALSLLGYRLQWEDALTTGWQSHHNLIDDLLPAFLASARWTIPAAVSSPSRHPSDDPTATSLSASTASLSASTSSLSSSSSSRRLSSLGSSTPASASTMTRTIRQQMLALSLSQLTSHLRALHSTHLPLTATTLDKLIDISPEPLPDSFLDEQDRIEAEVGRTKRVEGFAGEMARQWKGADEVFWRGCEVEKDAEKLAKEAEEAVSLLPSVAASTGDAPPAANDPSTFPTRLSALSSSLHTLRSSLSSLPSPSHPLAPSQYTSETPRLIATLRKNVDRAASAVEHAGEKVNRWERARNACEAAEGGRGELERAKGLLESVREELQRITGETGRPPRPDDGIGCLDQWEGEEGWQQRWDAALSPSLPLIAPPAAQSLLRRAADALGALSSLSSPAVAPSLRREVRELAHAVRTEVDAVKAMEVGEERRREVVGAAREAKEAVERAREVVREEKAEVARRVGEERWKGDEPTITEEQEQTSATTDPNELVKPTREAVEAALSAPLKAAEELLSPSPATAPLLDHLRFLRSSVQHDDLASLFSLASLLQGVQAQASSVRRFSRQAGEIDRRLRLLSDRTSAAMLCNADSWNEEEVKALRAELQGDDGDCLEHVVNRLVKDTVQAIPFVAHSNSDNASWSAVTTVPDFDLGELDASVREYVNSTSAGLKGRLDEVMEQLRLLEHREEAVKWDEEARQAQEVVAKVEREMEDAKKKVNERENDAEATLTPLLAHCSSLGFTFSASALEALSSSFDRLLASPSSSSAPFNAHPARRTRLDALTSRLDAARSAAAETKKQLLDARKAREEKVEQWAKKRDELVERLKEKEEQLKSIAAEAKGLDGRVSAARERAAVEREQLFRAEDLSSEADAPCPEADEAISALTSLRFRLDSERATLDSLSSTLDTLRTFLPSLNSPSTDLASASTAHSSALSASSAADAALSQLDRSLSFVSSDAEAWRTRREAELERRRFAAEEAAAAFSAWRTRVEDLVRRVGEGCSSAESLLGQAEEEMRHLERRGEEGKKAREDALVSPALAAESPLPHPGAASETSECLLHLREELRELRGRGGSYEGEATALRDEEPAASPDGRPLLATLDERTSALVSTLESVEAALVALAERVGDVERDEREWEKLRDAEVKRRKAEAEERRREEEERMRIEEDERRRVEEEERRGVEEEREKQGANERDEQSQHSNDTFPSQGLRRSHALPALAIVEADEEDDPFAASSPSSPPDPFAARPSLHDPVEVQRLHEQIAAITAQEWLDSSMVLQLPSVDDAAEVRRQVDDCRDQLDVLEAKSPDLLVWTDVDGMKRQLDEKDEALKRVSILAEFGAKVDRADAALSDLLNSIDAASPDMGPPPSEDEASAVLPLPQAIKLAGQAVSTIRLAAAPIADDARVGTAVERVEETWHEMLSMAEVPRPTSSASSFSTPSQPSLKPRTSDSASSRASSRTLTRTSSVRGPPRPSSQTSSLRSSTRPSSRPPSSASSTLVRSSSRLSTTGTPSRPTRPSSAALLSPQTPRRKRDEEDTFATPTPRRRIKSGLPVPSTVHRTTSPLPRAPPTVVRPFSFNTPTKRDLATSTSSIPRRVPSSASRRDSIASTSSFSNLFSPPMQRISSTSTTSSRRDSLASSVSTASGSLRRSSYSARPSISALAKSPQSTMPRSTPPRRTQPYRPKDNKLDRAVGDIVNSLSIHVPIAVADGKWTDDSGVYLIGGRLVFCRILRSKQVMCRTGGGWENLLSFVVSHFGTAAGLTISPSTSLKKNLSSAEPEWISSQAVRDQLAASQSSASLRDYLSSSVSSSLDGAGKSDLSLSTSSFSLRRSVSGGMATPLRRSIGGAGSFSTFSPSSTMATPKTRPPLPVWRP